MIAIHGMGSFPEPLRAERPKESDAAPKPSSGFGTDGVELSPLAAQTAALGARIAEADGQDEIRQELVSDVRQRMEEGTHQLQDVVSELASRISKFVA